MLVPLWPGGVASLKSLCYTAFMDASDLPSLADLCAALRSDCRLAALYLFGSYARNEADEESDLDLLIVLDEVENYSREITRTSELVSELSLKYGISISRFFSSEEQWRDDTTLFFVNLREEAISA